MSDARPDEVLPQHRRAALMERARKRDAAKRLEGAKWCPSCRLELPATQFRLGARVCWCCASSERARKAVKELQRAREEERRAQESRDRLHGKLEREEQIESRKRAAAGEREE